METILILDFGGQYKELIARRVRECGVYSIIKPNTVSLEAVRKVCRWASSSPAAPTASTTRGARALGEAAVFALGVPVLGICYGMQLIDAPPRRRGRARATPSEYGHAEPSALAASALFAGCVAAESRGAS